MQPLSEEVMSSRHILGRLYGPIATCIESTRNGRLYNRPLWENALRDEIFLEKVATKALFLELGHPADREETDMKQACACIPEVPKIVGDDLYAYVDILDTPNGRLLKTLVDYGFVPGISSRGSGDVMDNNQVDPETFFLETWDIVQLPAVKKARLNVCESLDSTNIQLKRALAESYKTAKDEDKDTMKKALNNLNIDIKEELSNIDEATSITETLQLSDDLEKQIKDLIGLYAEKITYNQTDRGVQIITIMNGQVPNKEKGHEEMIEILENNGYKVVDELFQDNTLIKKGMSFIDIDKKQAQEALTEKTVEDTNKKVLTDADIPWDDEETPLVEDAEDTADIPEETTEEATEEATDEVEVEVEDAEEDDSEEEVEDATNESEEDSDEAETDDTSEEDVELNTVGDAIELLQEYDNDMRVEFENIELNGEEYEIDKLSHFVDGDNEEDPILVIGVDCEPSEGSTEDEEEIPVETEEDAEEIDVESDTEDASEEEAPETDEDTESADDDGDEEVIESLKEMIRQKEAMENELNTLRKANAVGNAKVEELQEKLVKFRTAFRNARAVAVKVPELKSEVAELTEQLKQSDAQIETLTEKVNNARQLKESVHTSKVEVKRLNEAVSTLEAKLEGQTKVYTEKLQERTNLAKSYKARFIETLTKYVESKANMLGVNPSEITSRLNENYTLADVDAVCDQILESTVNFGRLPFSGRAKTSARIMESVSKPVRTSPEYGYEVDDALLELAGLKK
jgi:hypothetical protein